jgi:myo-inositol-1(or 4)-monophosphatase
MGQKVIRQDKSQFLNTAIEASKLAGRHILDNLGKLSKDEIDSKQASDFVTRVDRESEDIIIGVIKEQFPDHHFLAEESHKDNEPGKYRWIIDPLDGTTNFIHQYPAFAVSIALEHNSEIITGVIFDPLKNELFTAEKERGAFLNDNVIRVSQLNEMPLALITTGFPFRAKQLLDDYLRLFKNILIKVSDIRRAGSAALDLAHLACGRCDGFFEIGLSPWDVAAGSIIIKEAGGIISDFGGGNNYLSTGNIVAGTPFIHIAILNEVKRVFKGLVDS